jgi:hypothetical protein
MITEEYPLKCAALFDRKKYYPKMTPTELQETAQLSTAKRKRKELPTA